MRNTTNKHLGRPPSFEKDVANHHNALKIIEIDNFGPLYEKGVRVNDIILEINEEEGTWSNLTKSLRFAGLGNNIQLKVSSENSSLKVIDISADQTKKIN